MKKRIIYLFFIIGLLCAGCSRFGSQQGIVAPESSSVQDELSKVQGEEGKGKVEPLLAGYLSGLDVLEVPVREYGENTGHILLEEDLVVHILYPTGEIPALNHEIQKWVTDTVAYYQAEVEGSSGDGDAAELTVEYNSYITAKDLVSVKLTGVFDQPYLAHPIDVVATFSADRKTGKVLKLTDLLLQGGDETLRDMVVEQAGIDPEVVDDGLLDLWILNEEGLEITLKRGDYLPMSDGSVTLFYPYEELTEILALPEDPVQDSPQIDPVQGEDSAGEDQKEPKPATPDMDKPMLALTFDDGPSKHTARLLDAFAQYGGKGTFFVVGNLIEGREDTLQRMTAEGHEIGGHSWNHRQLTKLGKGELTDQIMNTRAKIYDATGVDTTIMRPPYGSYNDQVKTVSAGLDVTLINWSVDTLDWKHKDADAVYEAVMEEAKDGAIILCHDLYETTVAAMERAIPDLIAQGYQLVTVSELLEGNGKILEAGKVYTKK